MTIANPRVSVQPWQKIKADREARDNAIRKDAAISLQAVADANPTLPPSSLYRLLLDTMWGVINLELMAVGDSVTNATVHQYNLWKSCIDSIVEIRRGSFYWKNYKRNIKADRKRRKAIKKRRGW